jgi:hypothetical protein
MCTGQRGAYWIGQVDMGSPNSGIHRVSRQPSLGVVVGFGWIAATILAVTDAQARQACGVSLGETSLGRCALDGTGRIPGTPQEALLDLENHLPKHVRDDCARDKPAICDCVLPDPLETCWGLAHAESPLGKWFGDRGVSRPEGISKVMIELLHRRLTGSDITATEIDRQIDLYLIANRQAEAEYVTGVFSGSFVFAVVRLVGKEGWVDVHGNDIPRVSSFFVPLIEYSRAGVEACWKAIPKPQRAGFLTRTALRVTVSRDAQLEAAVAENSTLHPEYTACIVKALVGAPVFGHAGASYTITVETYRGDPSGMPEIPARNVLLWIAGGASCVMFAVVGIILMVRRRRSRRDTSGTLRTASSR